MKKNSIFFNMDHILHRLDDLIDVIMVILSKQKYITLVVSKNRCNIFFFLPYYEAHAAHSRTISLCHVIVTSAASNMCHVHRCQCVEGVGLLSFSSYKIK